VPFETASNCGLEMTFCAHTSKVHFLLDLKEETRNVNYVVVYLLTVINCYFIVTCLLSYKLNLIWLISDFRGFLARKKWGPILEERIKRIVATHKNIDSAKQALEVTKNFLKKFLHVLCLL
jgi:hypothetical protein